MNATGSTGGVPETTAVVDDTATEGGPAPVDCQDDTECMDPARPFCSPIFRECVSCEEVPNPAESCMSLDPTRPVCDDAECVQCSAEDTSACTGYVPVCDVATRTCTGCTEHEQCGTSACNLFTGACVEGPVVTVGPARDYATLTDAAANVVAAGGGTIIVYQDSYNEPVTIDGEMVVAFVANEGDRPTWYRTVGEDASQLRSTGGATVLVEGLDFRQNPAMIAPTVRADEGALWLDRSIIARGYGPALSAESTMSVVVRNSFIEGAEDLPTLSITSAAVVLRYSTVGAGLGFSTAITCAGGSEVEVTDSIIVTRGENPGVDCASLTATRTASNASLPNGTDNVEVGATSTAWFMGYNDGDFHLTPAGVAVFMDIAQWNGSDPTVDIDGEPRAGVNGTAEAVGADLP